MSFAIISTDIQINKTTQHSNVHFNCYAAANSNADTRSRSSRVNACVLACFFGKAQRGIAAQKESMKIEGTNGKVLSRGVMLSWLAQGLRCQLVHP